MEAGGDDGDTDGDGEWVRWSFFWGMLALLGMLIF